MAYPTEEICKIEPFRFRVCTKVSFGSCSVCITIQLTIHGYLEAPFSWVLNRTVYSHIPNLDALYFRSYYFATPPCFGSCNFPQSVSSIVIYTPSFDLMFKQLNKVSKMVVHFTGRLYFPSKNLLNFTKEEILLVRGINYGNYTNIETRLCFAGDAISYPY